MATTTHTDVFDPQTEADFARIEADAAAAHIPDNESAEVGVKFLRAHSEEYAVMPGIWFVCAAWVGNDSASHTRVLASRYNQSQAAEIAGFINLIGARNA